ncbi:MAG: hypothetical protein NVS3B20_18570 [Polyangiales bacterium]
MLPGLQPALPDPDLGVVFAGLVPYARSIACILPTVAIVPVLAMQGSSPQLKLLVALALSIPIAPSFPLPVGFNPEGPPLAWFIAIFPHLAHDLLRGIPLAIMIATPLWVATHIGSIADVLRGTLDPVMSKPASAQDAHGPLSVLTSLLAASVWLGSGGAVRALILLKASSPTEAPAVATWALAARTLSDGLRLSVALSSGVLVASITFEVAVAAIGRVSAPISPQPLAMLARPLVAIVALALSIEGALALLGPSSAARF